MNEHTEASTTTDNRGLQISLRTLMVLVACWGLLFLAVKTYLIRDRPPQLHGHVTLDGRLLESGRIKFISQTPGGRDVVQELRGGEYAFSASDIPVPGTFLVKINAPKQINASVVETVPSRYNSRTKMSVDISAGRQRIDFELTTQKLP